MDELKDRLRSARVRAGYETGTDAAHALGISVSTYLGYENGDRAPGRTAAAKLARGFRISLDWLVTGRHQSTDGRPVEDDPDWVSLHGMPDDAKANLRTMVEILRKSADRS